MAGSGNKKGGLGTLLILALAALAIYYFWGKGGADKTTLYTDYPSVGAAVGTQLQAHEENVAVDFRTSDYNQILGIAPVWKKIMVEAVGHTGDPERGDHLVMSLGEYEVGGSYTDGSQGMKDLHLRVKMTYADTLSQEQELKEAADRILKSLKLDGASEYEKAVAIYRYICDHVVYDYAHVDDDTYLLKQTAYAAAVQGRAVCAGIADLFYYLANSAGLDARIICNDTHAWNFVRVDGKYYYMDATWDLGRRPEEYEYCLKGSADFQFHMGNVTFSFLGMDNPLINSSKGYTFSSWQYGDTSHPY